jgi:hypothetical protein
MRRLLKFRNMNKYSIITSIAIAVIIASVMYGIWGIFSVEQLQFSAEKMPFRYFELSSTEKIRVCNPTPFFVSFNGILFKVYYQGDLKGQFLIDSNTMSPYTSKILDTNFTSENFSEAQYLFMHMDGEFSGDVPIRLDPNQMIISLDYDSRIIGVIPYHQTVTISAFDFSQMMDKESSCESSG